MGKEVKVAHDDYTRVCRAQDDAESDDDMNDDNDDDKTLSVLDAELESAVRLIEHDPVLIPYQYKFLVNNEQLCTDSVRGGLAPGLLCAQFPAFSWALSLGDAIA